MMPDAVRIVDQLNVWTESFQIPIYYAFPTGMHCRFHVPFC